MTAPVYTPSPRTITVGEWRFYAINGSGVGDIYGNKRGHSDAVVALAVDPEGDVFSGSSDGSISVWNGDDSEYLLDIFDVERDYDVQTPRLSCLWSRWCAVLWPCRWRCVHVVLRALAATADTISQDDCVSLSRIWTSSVTLVRAAKHQYIVHHLGHTHAP